MEGSLVVGAIGLFAIGFGIVAREVVIWKHIEWAYGERYKDLTVRQWLQARNDIAREYYPLFGRRK